MENTQPLDDMLFLSDLNSDKEKVELISTGKFVLLCILSLGLYEMWWMYKSWKFFKIKDNLDILPAARAFFAIFFTGSLFEKILRYAKINGYKSDYSSTSLFVLFIVLNLLSKLPDPYWMISFFSIVCLIQPHQALNFAISNSEKYEGVYRNGLNPRQIVLIVICVIFWILMIAGLTMPIDDF